MRLIGNRDWIIPAECRVTVDRRVIPGDTVEQAVGEMDALLERLRGARPAMRVERRTVMAIPPVEISPAKMETIIAAISASWLPKSSESASAQAANGIANWNSKASLRWPSSDRALSAVATKIPARTSAV